MKIYNKEIGLADYRNVVKKLIKSFSIPQFEHVPRAHDKHTDALVTLISSWRS